MYIKDSNNCTHYNDYNNIIYYNAPNHKPHCHDDEDIIIIIIMIIYKNKIRYSNNMLYTLCNTHEDQNMSTVIILLL